MKYIYIRNFFKKRSKHFVKLALKKYTLKKRYYGKYNFLFSYFKLFIYFYVFYRRLFFLKKRWIASIFIFSTGAHNNFINISRRKIFFFMSNGLISGRVKPKKNWNKKNEEKKKKNKKLKKKERKEKREKKERKKYFTLNFLLKYFSFKFMQKLNSTISIKYIKVKNYIKPILEYFIYLFNKYNEKIIKFKFFRLYKLIILEKKSYGFMKNKKIARKKKFLKKRKKKVWFYES